MAKPKITRPKFPKGYVDNPISEVPWEHVEKRLSESMNYWLCSVHPNGRPHAVPRWGAYLDGKLYYDGSSETRHPWRFPLHSSGAKRATGPSFCRSSVSFSPSAFMADLRIRYILPTVPFMTILAVTGIRNSTEWLHSRGNHALMLAGRAVPFAVALLIAANLVYLGNRFTDIRPLPYLLGGESRDDFVSRQVGSYPATAFINRNLPDDAVVYLLYLSGRGYYLNREYIHHAGQEAGIVKAMVRSSKDGATLTAFLRSLGGTHLLVREELLIKALVDNYPDETVRGVLEMLAKSLIKVYESNGHAVYVIR